MESTHGITLIQRARMSPDKDSARPRIEDAVLPNGRVGPHCKGPSTCEATHKKMPYQCRYCNRLVSVRKGMRQEKNIFPFRTRMFAIHLWPTSLDGISCMTLHRDAGVSQATGGSCSGVSGWHSVPGTHPHLAGRSKWTKHTLGSRERICKPSRRRIGGTGRERKSSLWRSGIRSGNRNSD